MTARGESFSFVGVDCRLPIPQGTAAYQYPHEQQEADLVRSENKSRACTGEKGVLDGARRSWVLGLQNGHC